MRVASAAIVARALARACLRFGADAGAAPPDRVPRRIVWMQQFG
jgi:hypothetical protein